MCKKLIVKVLVVAVLFSAAALADVDESGRLIVPETSVAPVIDGELEDVWQNVGEESLLITDIINAGGNVPPDDDSDLSGIFKVMYDADNIYFFLAVQDSVLDYEFSDYRGDSVEIYFDGDNSKGSSYDGINDNQIRINTDDAVLDDLGKNLPIDGTTFKVLLTDTGYNIEAAFPLVVLQLVPEQTFGFEVQLNDNDGGGDRETMIRWFSNDNNSWQDASLFGEAILVPEPEPVDPGSDGLVAYYAFENNADDSSGNGLNGTLVGDPVFVESLADYGMALDLDGIDDVVELGKFDVIGQITLATWVKADDFEINDARIISKANEWGGNDHWWMLSTISETSLRFRLKTDDGQETATLISDPVLEAGVWAHVAAAWDGSTMRIYKDGVEVANQEKGGSAVAVDPDISVAIGSQPSDAFASDPARVVKFFDGLIDEAHIYERALSEGEFLYLAGERATPVDPGANGLAAFYSLDNDVLDSSGNGNDGTIVGNPTWIDGVQGTALEFHGLGAAGGGGDYIDCGNDASLDIPGPISIALWIKPGADDPEGQGTETAPMAKAMSGISPWNWQVRYGWNSPQPYMAFTFNTSPRAWAYVGQNLIRNEWAHIACSHDGATLKCYLDGAQTDSTPMGEIATGEAPVLIGSDGWGCDWIGGIDEVAIYDRDLSDGEILYLAGYRADADGADPSLSIHYTFDEVGAVVADQSGKGHDGAVVGEVTADPAGMIAGAAKFANAGYLDLDGPSFAAEDIPTSGITLAAWIKCENNGSHHALFNARASDQTWLVHPEARSNGEFRWLLRSYGGTTMFDIRAGAVTWDEWLHFAGTYDKASAKAALCINGELVSEMDVASPDDIAGDWGLGARVGKNIDDARPFTGLMDEFRLYTRALSQDEIVDMMAGM